MQEPMSRKDAEKVIELYNQIDETDALVKRLLKRCGSGKSIRLHIEGEEDDPKEVILIHSDNLIQMLENLIENNNEELMKLGFEHRKVH